MKMMLIWCILCSFFALAFGIDNGFSYGASCFSDGGTAEMTATYTGNGTVTAVQWYYSGQNSQNLFVNPSNCQAVPPKDTGYPPASRMEFECNMVTNVYKLRLLRLEAGDFDKSWGVTFSLSVGASPDVDQGQIKQCTTSNDNDNGLSTGKIVGIAIAIAVVVGAITVVVILAIMKKLPCNKPGRYHPTNNSHGDKPSNKK